MNKLDITCMVSCIIIGGAIFSLVEYIEYRNYGKLLGQMALNEANRVKLNIRMDACNKIFNESQVSGKEEITEETNM